MNNQDYPYNLIYAMYKDVADSQNHINAVHVPSLYATLELIPKNEHIVLLRRYRDGVTLSECGRSSGHPASAVLQLISNGLKRLRRYGNHNYFQVNPATGFAYNRDEIKPYIGELKLSTGTENCLVSAGYSTIEKVRPLSEDELKLIHKFGEKHYQEFVEKLSIYEQANGLTPYPKEPYPDNLARAVFKNRDATIPLEPDEMAQLNFGLTTLSKQELKLVLMKYKDGQSMTDIGKQVNMTGNVVNQTIQRAVRKLTALPIKQVKETLVETAPKQVKKGKNESKPQLKDIYPYNLLTEIFGRNDNLSTVYVNGLHQQIETLPEIYRTYVMLRYEFGLTRVNCGKRMEKTGYQIEQLEMLVHRKLRDKKDDGLLTAVPTKQYVDTLKHRNQLIRENEALKNLVRAITDGNIKPEDIEIQTPQDETERLDGVLITPIEELDISVRAHKALSLNRWDTLHDITRHTRDEFKALRRVGATVENEIDELLTRYGLSFKGESAEELPDNPVNKPLSTLDVRDAELGLRDAPLVIEMVKTQ